MRTASPALLLLAGIAVPAAAQEKNWYVVFNCGSSRGCQQFWGAGEKRLGPATKAECDAAIANRSANSYPTSARCVQNPAGGGATTTPASTASALESTIANGLSTLPLDQQLVIGGGYSFLRWLFDDADRSEARTRERASAVAARDAAVAMERQRQVEEEARLAAEARARDQQRAQGILDRMKGDRPQVAAGPTFKTGDSAVESLRPTPAPLEPLFSRPQQTYVDLYNLQRGAALLLMAQTVPTPQGKFLEDQAMAVAEGLAEPSRTFTSALPEIGEDGLRAFQEANNEYRRVRDSGLAPFQGSPDADARFRDKERNLLAKRAALLAAAQSASPDVSAALKQAAEAMQAGLAGLGHLRRLPPADAAREAARAADEWRKNVALMMASGKDDWVESVRFIRQAQAAPCVTQPGQPEKTKTQCMFEYAEKHKQDDMALYIPRRNAEHFLFSKLLAEDPSQVVIDRELRGTRRGAAVQVVISQEGVFFATPAYSIYKFAEPVAFRTSKPTVDEVAFGWLGTMAGLGADPLGIEK